MGQGDILRLIELFWRGAGIRDKIMESLFIHTSGVESQVGAAIAAELSGQTGKPADIARQKIELGCHPIHRIYFAANSRHEKYIHHGGRRYAEMHGRSDRNDKPVYRGDMLLGINE